MTKYMEVTVNFVIPDDDYSQIFVNRLENLINDHVYPRLVDEEFYYYGVWVDEWLSDPPIPERAVAFSLGLRNAPHNFGTRDGTIIGDYTVKDSNVKSPEYALGQLEGRIAGDRIGSSKDGAQFLAGFEAGLRETGELSREKNSDEDYSRGYLDGFEAGGGDVVDYASKMGDRPYPDVRSREKNNFTGYTEGYYDGFEAGGGDIIDYVAKMREAAFLLNLLGTSDVRSLVEKFSPPTDSGIEEEKGDPRLVDRSIEDVDPS